MTPVKVRLPHGAQGDKDEGADGDCGLFDPKGILEEYERAMELNEGDNDVKI